MRVWSLLLFCGSVALAGAQDGISKPERKVRAFLSANKPYKAINICNDQLRKNAHPEFFPLRADALNRIAEHDAAERDARAGMAQLPDPTPSLFQLAIAEMGMGRLDSARIHMDLVLGTDRSGEVRFRRAQIHQLQRQYAEAIAQVNAALHESARNAADSARYLRTKAEAQAMLGEMDKATTTFELAMRLVPDDPVTLNSRGWFLHAKQGDHAAAIRDYDRAIKLNPNYSYAFNNRGWSYYKLGNKDRALKDISLARRKKAYNPYIYRNLGVIALEEGDKSGACTQFRHAIDLGFTALYGTEVVELIETNCGAQEGNKAPGQAPNAPLDRPQQKPVQRTNAP